MAKKKIEQICKNCKLYDPDKKLCSVIILHEGEKVSLNMEPGESCFFEQEMTVTNDKGKKETFKMDIQQIRVWVENKKGEKTTRTGVGKIEYPVGFFPGEDK